MKWQQESGLMKREEIRWISKPPECEGGHRDFMTVGIVEIKSAIYLLFIGYAISTLICIVEHLLPKILFPFYKTSRTNEKPIMLFRSKRSLNIKAEKRLNDAAKKWGKYQN